MAASKSLPQRNRDGSRGAVAALQALVGAVTPLALISIGGLGIYLAPILLPLLWIAANACRGSGRWYFTGLAALTAALTAWAIAWSLLPSLQLALPLVAAVATMFLFNKTWRRNLSLKRVAITLLALGAFGLTGIGSLAAGGESRITREVTFEHGS